MVAVTLTKCGLCAAQAIQHPQSTAQHTLPVNAALIAWQADVPLRVPKHHSRWSAGYVLTSPFLCDAAWRMGPRQRHAGQMPEGGVPGAANAMPANLFRMRRGPGMHVRMIRIDLKALVQMAVVALVLYQVCALGKSDCRPGHYPGHGQCPALFVPTCGEALQLCMGIPACAVAPTVLQLLSKLLHLFAST